MAEEPGVVRELYVGAGDGVTPGTPLGLIRPTGSKADGARVVAYVTPQDARDFRPGNPISVLVPDVSRGTDQTLSAEAERVAELPTSLQGMTAEVETPTWPRSSSRDDGSPTASTWLRSTAGPSRYRDLRRQVVQSS